MTDRPMIYEVNNPKYKKLKKNDSYAPQPGSIDRPKNPQPVKSLAEQIRDRETWWAEYQKGAQLHREEKVRGILRRWTLAEQLKEQGGDKQ
jgi:hypothetical protein